MELDVAILGAGAAGMMAAVAGGEVARRRGGREVRIAAFEKNVRAGIKVLVCGGGRCNFTNAGTVGELIARFGRCGRFLEPALRHLDNEALRDFFAGLGVPSHVEQDGKVYPDSNQARSVVDALVNRMAALGVQVFAGPQHAVNTVQSHSPAIENQKLKMGGGENPGFAITTADGSAHTARLVIVAVGGMSYQRMGTVGDGYRIAASLGHAMVTPRPAIVGLIAAEPWIKDLQGLAVRDVEVTLESPPNQNSKLKTQKSIGDMLFTHFGLSGPAILNPSEVVAEMLENAGPHAVTVRIDFARHVTHEAAHALLRSWQQHHGKKRLRTMLASRLPEILIKSTSPDTTAMPAAAGGAEATGNAEPLALPARLAVKVCALEGLSPERPCALLTSSQIHKLVERVKRCPFTVTATRGFAEAMVTAGGVSLKEVNPHTMESRLVPGLFLTGEVLDLTGPSGGYNLQLAFSTGHLAGSVAAERLLT